jgi:hypothetical protein
MGILIGMDEAGYGPNYGPLVVAATTWHVDDAEERGRTSEVGADEFALQDVLASAATPNKSSRRASASAARAKSSVGNRQSEIGPVDLYRLLRAIICKSASEKRIAIADSKVLYKPGLGLRQLERGIHAVLDATGQSAARWSALRTACVADPSGHCPQQCWHDGFDCEIPADATANEMSHLSARFSRACGAVGTRPLAIRARYIFPAEFNELVAHYGSKGAALSHVTVGLLREVIHDVGSRYGYCGESGSSFDSSAPTLQPPIFALCDKHGGRNYYTALLQHHFSDHWVNPTHESHVESRYEWGPAEARVRVVFRMQGERFLPTALASMTAKYLRELAMRPFNEFWCARVPGLRPTAGYPMDSHRFRKAIAAKQRELGIDDHVIWRNR